MKNYYKITISNTAGICPDIVEYFHGRRVKSSKPYKELYHKFAYEKDSDYNHFTTAILTRIEYLKETNNCTELLPIQIKMINVVIPYYNDDEPTDLAIKKQLQSILLDGIYIEKQTNMLNGIRAAYHKGMFKE